MMPSWAMATSSKPDVIRAEAGLGVSELGHLVMSSHSLTAPYQEPQQKKRGGAYAFDPIKGGTAAA